MEESRNPKLPEEIQEKHTVGRRDLFKIAAGAAALVGTRAGGSALMKGAAGGAPASALTIGNFLWFSVRSRVRLWSTGALRSRLLTERRFTA